MITAKEFMNIANQNQCTPEEENIITTILNYCKQDAEKGKYETDFRATLHLINNPSLCDAMLYFKSPKVEIKYLKLKNQLKSLGFYFGLLELSDYHYLDAQEVIITIKWGE